MNKSNVSQFKPASSESAQAFFASKLAFETDCSDVYGDIKSGNKDYVLLDVRSFDAFYKSHALSAQNLPHLDISADSLAAYGKDTLFVVYCWGPGCNGATKAAMKLSALGFQVKEMIGGIHYWEDLERFPVVRYGQDGSEQGV